MPFYSEERASLLEHTHTNFENTRSLNNSDQFIWLMSQKNNSCLLKIAQFLQKAFSKRQKGASDTIKSEEVKPGCINFLIRLRFYYFSFFVLYLILRYKFSSLIVSLIN